MMMITEYHESKLYRQDGPFAGELIKAEGALCPDGKRRNAHPSFDGVADTFFSIPAFVYVRRTRVYGYVTVETLSGFTTSTDDDPATVKFVPYTYRKNHHLIEPIVRDIYGHEVPRGEGPFKNIDEIKQANREAGKFFFSPDTMRFFDSHILTGVIGGRFFITSEQPPEGPRRYSVRVAWEDGGVSTMTPGSAADEWHTSVFAAQREVDGYVKALS
jgi:hypothetical protein